jgi:hypothetical protein
MGVRRGRDCNSRENPEPNPASNGIDMGAHLSVNGPYEAIVFENLTRNYVSILE